MRTARNLPTMSYTTNDAGLNKKVAECLQQAWKELGINVEVNIVEWKSFIEKIRKLSDCKRRMGNGLQRSFKSS